MMLAKLRIRCPDLPKKNPLTRNISIQAIGPRRPPAHGASCPALPTVERTCIVQAPRASGVPKSEGDTMAKAVKAVQLSLLFLVVISVVAVAPASAASPEWWVEGSEIAKAQTVAEAVTIKQAPTFKVGSIVTVTCST